MKPLLRFPLLLFTALALLVSCKKEDPLKGKLRYKVELHVTGQNLTGLGAEMSYTSVRNTLTDPKPGPGAQYSYPVSVDETYDLGEFGMYDALEVTLAMRNVMCNNAAQLGPNSWLKAEIRANGVLIDKLELNSASAHNLSCAAPYLALVAAVGGSGGDGWDD